MLPDHYQALGVHPLASEGELRAAYLRIMRAHHPDRRPGDPRSAVAARRANAAWEVLGDRARRASYDRLRASADGRGPGVRPAARSHIQRPAYGPASTRYRHAFLRASQRVAVGVLVLGLVLLLVTP